MSRPIPHLVSPQTLLNGLLVHGSLLVVHLSEQVHRWVLVTHVLVVHLLQKQLGHGSLSKEIRVAYSQLSQGFSQLLICKALFLKIESLLHQVLLHQLVHLLLRLNQTHVLQRLTQSHQLLKHLLLELLLLLLLQHLAPVAVGDELLVLLLSQRTVVQLNQSVHVRDEVIFILELVLLSHLGLVGKHVLDKLELIVELVLVFLSFYDRSLALNLLLLIQNTLVRNQLLLVYLGLRHLASS